MHYEQININSPNNDPTTFFNKLMNLISDYDSFPESSKLTTLAQNLNRYYDSGIISSVTTSIQNASNSDQSALDQLLMFDEIDNYYLQQLQLSTGNTLKQFITDAGSNPSLVTSYFNGNQTLEGWLAMNNVPTTYSATIDAFNMRNFFPTSNVLGGLVDYINTIQSNLQTNAATSYIQYADPNTNQGIVLDTSNQTTQGLA